MRALARHLGVEAMSLYHHVADKDALLDGMVDVVFGEIHLPVVGGGWRTGCGEPVCGRRCCCGTAGPSGSWTPAARPARRRCATTTPSSAALRCRASRSSQPRTAFALLDAHLYGFVHTRCSLPFEGEADLTALGAEILGPEVRAAYPHFTAFAEGRALQPGYAFGNEFEVTLDLVLGSLEALASATPAAAASSAGLPPIEVRSRCWASTGAGRLGRSVARARRTAPRIVVAPTIAELVAMVRESTGVRVVGIDIPIGLPDSTIRQADVLARRALPGKASSIFSTLTRSAYAAATRLEADTVNRGLVGQGVGAQAFALRDKVLEVRHLAAHPPHPHGARDPSRGLLRDDVRRHPDRGEQEDRRGPGQRLAAGPSPGSPALRCSRARDMPPTTCSTPAPSPGRPPVTPRASRTRCRTRRKTLLRRHRRGDPSSHPGRSEPPTRPPDGFDPALRARVGAMTARVSHTTVDCRDALQTLSERWKGVPRLTSTSTATRTSPATRSA